jgi:3-oxoacyl-(acyl-carrier-protein) synthase
MKQPISILSIASISALGNSQEEIWSNYLNDQHGITEKKFEHFSALVAQISKENSQEITALKKLDSKYKNLDNSVLYAMLVARKAIKKTAWEPKDNFGINIGSSRGATTLFEKYHREFLSENKTSTLSSPTTTLGNISSWVAHDLQTSGPEISHSITCSTALHSLLNGIAWLQAGMSDKFLVGGSEAALTDFTIAQMQALKIYAKGNAQLDLASQYPCRAFDLEKKENTMVIGEGAAVICLERGVHKNAIAQIIGIGYATEILAHNISISAEANCFQKSMNMALGEYSPDEIDVIVMHAPGTIKGDSSEVNAIKKVFCNNVPFLTTNKWKLGHTFGASGMLSVEFAVLMLQYQQAIEVPFAEKQQHPKKIKKVLINAVGFGGNAVSILLTK